MRDPVLHLGQAVAHARGEDHEGAAKGAPSVPARSLHRGSRDRAVACPRIGAAPYSPELPAHPREELLAVDPARKAGWLCERGIQEARLSPPSISAKRPPEAGEEDGRRQPGGAPAHDAAVEGRSAIRGPLPSEAAGVWPRPGRPRGAQVRSIGAPPMPRSNLRGSEGSLPVRGGGHASAVHAADRSTRPSDGLPSRAAGERVG
jgi:hypothetical protein